MTDPSPSPDLSDPTRPADPPPIRPAEPPADPSVTNPGYPPPPLDSHAPPATPSPPGPPTHNFGTSGTGSGGYPPEGYATPGYATAGYATPGYGTAGYGTAGYGQSPYGPQYVVSQPTNGLALAAMIVSILGFGPVGAIMGHVARKQIRERGEQGDGFALAGIVVGWVTTAIWVLCCGGYLLAAAGALGTSTIGGLQ